MWMLGLYIILYFGIPAGAVLTAIIFFWRNSVRENQALQASPEVTPEQLKKAKTKKIALTVAVVIGGVLVAAIVAVAILFSTAIAFM